MKIAKLEDVQGTHVETAAQGAATGDLSSTPVVTPEMIEAGCEVIWSSFNDVMAWGDVTARGIAIEVFEAMSRARVTAQDSAKDDPV